MGYLLVLLAALIVGVLVYRVSLKQEALGPGGPHDVSGSSAPGEAAPPAPADQPGTIYLPVLPSTGTWETRVTGIVGILVVIALTATALGLGLYLAGTFVAKLFGAAASNGGLAGATP